MRTGMLYKIMPSIKKTFIEGIIHFLLKWILTTEIPYSTKILQY